jgi:malate permease and related proteins
MQTSVFAEGLITSVDIIGQMAILVLTGYLMVKWKWISSQTLSDLTRILINIVIPCSFILSMTRSLDFTLFRQGLILALVATGWIVASWIFGIVWFRIFPGGSKSREKSVTAMMMIPNSIYLPIPVLLAVMPASLHDQIIVYISITALPSIVFMWTAGVLLLSGSSRPETRERVKLMFNPPVVSLFAGILLTFVPGVRSAALGDPGAFLPLKTVFSVMGYLAGILSPLAMLILGGMIASSRRNQRLRLSDIAPLIMVRLIAAPAAVYLLVKTGALNLPAVAYTILIVVAAAPPATNHVLIARRYNGEWELVSSLQLIVHVAALVTLPLWLTLALNI